MKKTVCLLAFAFLSLCSVSVPLWAQRDMQRVNWPAQDHPFTQWRTFFTNSLDPTSYNHFTLTIQPFSNTQRFSLFPDKRFEDLMTNNMLREIGQPGPIATRGFLSKVGSHIYHDAGNGLLKRNFESLGEIYNATANVFRAEISNSFNRKAALYWKLSFSPSPHGDVFTRSPGGIYVPRHNIWNIMGRIEMAKAGAWGEPTDAALMKTRAASRIFIGASTVMFNTLAAAELFLRTFNYIGRSMQFMNPPIYLNERTPEGFRGERMSPVPGGYVSHRETLKTVGPGPFVRVHTDLGISREGTFNRQVITTTPVTGWAERLALSHFPVGSYFGSSTKTVHYSTQVFQVGSGLQKNWNTSLGIGDYTRFGNFEKPRPLPTLNVPDHLYHALTRSWSRGLNLQNLNSLHNLNLQRHLDNHNRWLMDLQRQQRQLDLLRRPFGLGRWP